MTAPVIAPLSGTAEASIVAGWIWDEWARHEPGVSRAGSDAVVHAALQGARMPYFVVARIDGAPVGCASILATDLPTRPDLGPWLANVYVHAHWRGRGLGTSLVEHAMAYGARIADVLHLYTFDDPGFYERLGWRVHEAGRYTGRPITVMRHHVRSTSGR